MSNAVMFLRAQTSLHPGSGASVGSIDLPIQRERHTRWPNFQSSGIKGVLRDAYRVHLIEAGTCQDRDKANDHDEVRAIFGPASGDAHAGALIPTDARILAFPVRSARGVFAWVTCPGVIERAIRDMKMAGMTPSFSTVSEPHDEEAWLPSQFGDLSVKPNGIVLVLEDLTFNGMKKTEVDAFAQWLAVQGCGMSNAPAPGSGLGDPRKRLVVLSDTAFTHFVVHATEVTARIGLDAQTKKVRDGALFTQEFLPPETILYNVLLAVKPRMNSTTLTAGTVINNVRHILNGKIHQFGGDETTGKGWCWVRVETPTTPGGGPS